MKAYRRFGGRVPPNLVPALLGILCIGCSVSHPELISDGGVRDASADVALDSDQQCSSPSDCEVPDPCVSAVCSGGRCVLTPDSRLCEHDFQVCTIDEGCVCDASRCGAFWADENTCQTGVCGRDIADVETCMPASACGDGESCCGNGTCLDCTGSEDSCNGATCELDGDTAVCVQKPFEDGIACDDDNGCTLGDTCTAGICGGDSCDSIGLDCVDEGADRFCGGCDSGGSPCPDESTTECAFDDEGTPDTCSGTQEVTTFACEDDRCVERSEPRECFRDVARTVVCDSREERGGCEARETCDLEGAQRRDTFFSFCTTDGGCEESGSPETDSTTCDRVVAGDSCAEPTLDDVCEEACVPADPANICSTLGRCRARRSVFACTAEGDCEDVCDGSADEMCFMDIDCELDSTDGIACGEDQTDNLECTTDPAGEGVCPMGMRQIRIRPRVCDSGACILGEERLETMADSDCDRDGEMCDDDVVVPGDECTPAARDSCVGRREVQTTTFQCLGTSCEGTPGLATFEECDLPEGSVCGGSERCVLNSACRGVLAVTPSMCDASGDCVPGTEEMTDRPCEMPEACLEASEMCCEDGSCSNSCVM